jgi:hypothetical protein
MDWIGVGPAALLPLLEPLRAAHALSGPAYLVQGGPDCLADLPEPENPPLRSHDAGVKRPPTDWGEPWPACARPRSVLLIERCEPSATAPNQPGPWLDRPTGGPVLVGRLALPAEALAAYVARAVALLARAGSARGDRSGGDGQLPDTESLDRLPLVLMAPREERYLAVLAAVESAVVSAEGVQCLRWSAERIRRAPLLDALRLGAGVLLYHGHGHRQGWHAYAGLGAAEFAAGGAWLNEQTASVLFSLSCATAAPVASVQRVPSAGAARACETAAAEDGDAPRAGPGFAQALIEHGVAGAVVAPTGAVLHADNARLACALASALAAGARDLARLLAAVRDAGCALEGYLILGDPALPIAGSRGAAARGARVPAPAADAVLAHATAFSE